MPRSIRAVYAMARPRRPDTEREAVREAAARQSGSCAQRARRIAGAVAVLALRELDGTPADRVLLLLGTLEASPLLTLAVDPEVDTAAAIRVERAMRMEARRWRRPTPAEWDADDRALLAAVTERLAKRYARHLVGFQP